MFRDNLLVLQKSKSPQNRYFEAQIGCMDLCGTVYFWVTVGFQKVCLKKNRLNFLQKVQRNHTIFGIILDKEVKTLDDHDWPKKSNPWCCSSRWSKLGFFQLTIPTKHYTSLRLAPGKHVVTEQWSNWSSKTCCIVECIFTSTYLHFVDCFKFFANSFLSNWALN